MPWSSSRIQRVILGIWSIFVIYTLYNFSDQYDITYSFCNKIPLFNDSQINYALRKKYITSTFEHPGDLGNMLFRFASLYGIGKSIDRVPYVNASIVSQIEGLTELSANFPLIHDLVEIKTPEESIVNLAEFSDDCCIYESPAKLKNYVNSKYLKLKSNYLQSYKFFDQYREDIVKLMECIETVKEKATEVAKELWKNDMNSHKLCIHIRRGDFVENWPLESRMDFIDPAIEYIYKQLHNVETFQISLFNFGNDEEFIKNMTFPNLSFTSINNLFSYNISRSFDMCFAIQYCDTLLISASSSSYSWWIGYLMKSRGTVFYNAEVTSVGTHPKDTHDYDLFLPEWKRLLVKNGKANEETRWTLERS